MISPPRLIFRKACLRIFKALLLSCNHKCWHVPELCHSGDFLTFPRFFWSLFILSVFFDGIAGIVLGDCVCAFDYLTKAGVSSNLVCGGRFASCMDPFGVEFSLCILWMFRHFKEKSAISIEMFADESELQPFCTHINIGFLLLGWWCFSIEEFFVCRRIHSVSGRGVFCQPLPCSQNPGNLFYDPPKSRIRRGFDDITDSFRRGLPGHLYESKTQWDGVFLNCHPCPSFGRCHMSPTTRMPPRIQPDGRRPLLSAILHLGHCNEDFFYFPLFYCYYCWDALFYRIMRWLFSTEGTELIANEVCIFQKNYSGKLSTHTPISNILEIRICFFFMLLP